MPSMISTVVVLPAPLGPSMPKHTPSGTLNETPATAVVAGYCFTSSRTSMIGVLIGRNARAVTCRGCFFAVRDRGRQCTISPHEHRAVRQVRARRARRRGGALGPGHLALLRRLPAARQAARRAKAAVVRAQRDAVRHRAPGVGAVDAPDAA